MFIELFLIYFPLIGIFGGHAFQKKIYGFGIKWNAFQNGLVGGVQNFQEMYFERNMKRAKETRLEKSVPVLYH